MMGNEVKGYDQLIKKLDQFIRKFYINKVIRGFLYSIGLVIAMFLIFNFLEYYFYFGKGVRKLFFLSFIITSLFAFGYWVLYPLSKYFHLGKTISHEQAARIIGDHFKGVEDKLLNILQLNKQVESSPQKELLIAGIDQKTKAIRLVPFKSAIDLSKNKKYLKYALPPFLLFLFVLMAAPSIIKEGTKRIINNDKEFVPEAPFSFVFNDQNPQIIQFQDYTVNIKTEGEVVPAEAFIDIDGFQYRMKNVGAGSFEYTMRNVQKDVRFKVFSGRVSSKENKLKVLLKPNIADFSVYVNYPDYTGRKDERMSNTGDLVVPEGTVVTWDFKTANTDVIDLKFESQKESRQAKRKENNRFSFSRKIKNSDQYKILISNADVPNGDSLLYGINVIKDQYPTISAKSFVDSLEQDVVFFAGQAADDYGLSELTFNYIITTENGSQKPIQTIKIPFTHGKATSFKHTFDISALNLAPGENVTYYFEVRDNDAVNGAKSAKTGVMSFQKPTIDELKEQEQENEEDIKNNLEESIKDLEKLRENYRKMREKLLQENELNWQEKKELEKMLEEQKKLQEKIKEAQKKFEENLKNQEQLQQQNEEVQKKQEKLQEMFDEAISPEKQELMDKIEELMQELQKDNALEMMEQMDMENTSKEQELERLLELYKQLEVEKEAKEAIEKLNELAEKQEKLAEKTEKEQNPSEQTKAEQEKLNEEFEKLKKEIEELEKKNEELKNPKNLGDDNQEQMEDIQEDMEDAGDQMEKQDSKGASKSQKSAAGKMKKMAGKLQENMESGDQEQQEEDIKMIRQLLENLVDLSFDQEDLISDFSHTRSKTPRYVELVQTQYRIKDDFKIVEDSLRALAMRNDKVEGFVLEKVDEIKVNLKETVKQLEDRKTGQASEKQRRTMKNLNDLALMLSESMEQMQQDAGASMPGSQMCNKPGGKGGGKTGKVPSDKITQGSEGLEKKMKSMLEKQGKGQKPSSKDFAQAAARQAAMRKALQEMRDAAKEQGRGTKELDELIKQMDKIETDLVNKRLDNEMLKRQQQITTRLLEAEKAERKREYDNKRKAERPTEKKRKTPPALQEYLKQREAELEMYKSVSPSLRPFYKFLVDEYYRALKGD